uniref:GDSL esterase/lipase n=1 Tax=Oryza brachyantha TaxID=4533 RepID=J3N196_ORYBR
MDQGHKLDLLLCKMDEYKHKRPDMEERTRADFKELKSAIELRIPQVEKKVDELGVVVEELATKMDMMESNWDQFQASSIRHHTTQPNSKSQLRLCSVLYRRSVWKEEMEDGGSRSRKTGVEDDGVGTDAVDDHKPVLVYRRRMELRQKAAVGFNESPPAYLSLAANSNALVSAAVSGGINYASGAAGILDSTSAGRTIPLRKQVQYLESTKVQIETKLGSRATANLISTSFYLLEIGQNDLSVFSQSQSRDGDDVAAFYATVISNYSAVITDLYKMGARKFAVINVSPIGCLPVARLLNNTGGCIGSLNKLSLGLDHSIKTMLENLSCKLRSLAYSLGDIYSHTLATLQDPKAFGYVDIGSACCGNGRLNAESVCLPNSTLCTNRDGFFYWDRVHPSERAARLATAAFYDGPSRFTTPINFKQLAAAKKKEISARRFIDAGTDRVIYDGKRLHQPGITPVVTSFTTYEVQPKIGDPTSTALSDICKMTQGSVFNFFSPSAICGYINYHIYNDHDYYMIGYLDIHYNKSSLTTPVKNIRVIAVVHDTPAMTAGGNRGERQGTTQKEMWSPRWSTKMTRKEMWSPK